MNGFVIYFYENQKYKYTILRWIFRYVRRYLLHSNNYYYKYNNFESSLNTRHDNGCELLY